MLTRNGATVPRPARQPVLLVKRKNHVNGGVHFDGIAIEKSRLIAPLPDGIQRGLLQQGMAVQDFELWNRAVLADDRVQTHGARDARLTSERRIYRLNTVDNASCLNVAAYAKRASQLRLGGGGAPPMPPMTPPSTPPMEPPATPPGTPPVMPVFMSGSASSLIILTSLGMTFGAISLPASIKWACGLTWTTWAGAGGGGGGG